MKISQFKSEDLVLVFNSLLKALRNWTTINSQHLIEGIEFIVEAASYKTEFLQILEKEALDMGKQTEPIISKVMAGRMIPILCKYNAGFLKAELMDIIKRILTDSEVEAKKFFLQEIFPRLLEHLKLEYIELHLQEKIYEIIYD